MYGSIMNGHKVIRLKQIKQLVKKPIGSVLNETLEVVNIRKVQDMRSSSASIDRGMTKRVLMGLYYNNK